MTKKRDDDGEDDKANKVGRSFKSRLVLLCVTVAIVGDGCGGSGGDDDGGDDDDDDDDDNDDDADSGDDNDRLGGSSLSNTSRPMQAGDYDMR